MDGVRQCCLKVRQRWVVAVLAALAFAIAEFQCCTIYLTTSVLAMGNMSSIVEKQDCANFSTYAYELRKVFNWTTPQKGSLLAAYYVGSMFGQIPGGVSAVLFGGKGVAAVSVLCSSACSWIMSWAVFEEVWVVVLMRFLMGLSQGPLEPAIVMLESKWFPRNEKSLLNSIVYTGLPLGVFLGNIVPAVVISKGADLTLIFNLAAASGLLWFVFWQALIWSIPLDHPYINPQERWHIIKSLYFSKEAQRYLGHYIGKNKKLRSLPWISAFTELQMVILSLADFGFKWGVLILTMELPFYLHEKLHLNVNQLGIACASVAVGRFFGTLTFGALCDLLLSQKVFKQTTTVKMMAFVCCSISGICLLLASLSRCDAVLAAMQFSLAGFYCGAAASSVWLSVKLQAPFMSGFLVGISNTVSSIAGIVLPLLIHSSNAKQTGVFKEWGIHIYLSSLFMVVFPLPFIILTNSNIQSWSIGSSMSPEREPTGIFRHL